MQGQWYEIPIRGHLCDVYEPACPNEHGYVILYLHGVHLHRLVDESLFVEQFGRLGIPVVAPMTQRSWWSNRICPEFDSLVTAEQHVLEYILPFIKDRWGSEPPRIGLLGTSMGGQGALRFAYKFPDTFPVVAAISPAIDYHQRMNEGDENLLQMYTDSEEARQDTALLHIHPLYWPRHQFFCCDPADERWYDSTDRLKMKLASLGVPFECDLETTGGGHGFEYYNRMALRAVTFVADRLERERLRIV